MNYWNMYRELCKELDEKDRKWTAEKKSHVVVDNSAYYTREELRKGYGTACNPYTSHLGVYR